MRHFLIICIFSIVSGMESYSQGLTIEVAVEWKKINFNANIPPLKSDSVVLVPFLKLTYRNLTNENIYFKKPVPINRDYPEVIAYSLINTSMGLCERAKRHLNYAGQNFNVYLDDWLIISEQLDSSLTYYDEFTPEVINDDISNIYSVLIKQKILTQLNINKYLPCFGNSESKTVSFHEAMELIFEKRGGIKQPFIFYLQNNNLTKDDIFEEYRNEFVFLKKDDIFEEYFNLIGFYLVSGYFNFLFTDTVIKNHLQINKDQKVFFPKKVEGYNLYSGKFKTNNVGLNL